MQTHKHTHTHKESVERMERTWGAGISVPLFIGKTPCKLSQLSGPKLIQEFYKSLDRKHGVVLHFHFFSSAAPVNILLICCVVCSQGKHTKQIVTLIPWWQQFILQSGARFIECAVCVNTKPCKDYWLEVLLSIEILWFLFLLLRSFVNLQSGDSVLLLPWQHSK